MARHRAPDEAPRNDEPTNTGVMRRAKNSLLAASAGAVTLLLGASAAPASAPSESLAPETRTLDIVAANPGAVLRQQNPTVQTVAAPPVADPPQTEVQTVTAPPAPAPVFIPKPAVAAPPAAPPVVRAPAPVPPPPAPAAGRGALIAAAALAQLGIAQDCTALVTRSIAAVGINYHGWPAGYLSLGVIVATPEPGDIAYYANGGAGVAHVAIYIGGGMAVHGGWNGQTVKQSVNVGSGPVFIRV